MSPGPPRRTDNDPAVETFLTRQRQREHYEKMQQEQARRQNQAAAGGDERRLVPQRSLTYEVRIQILICCTKLSFVIILLLMLPALMLCFSYDLLIDNKNFSTVHFSCRSCLI